MRRKLCVGIDSYKNFEDLSVCVNDANTVKAILEQNDDGTVNFDVKTMCATGKKTYIFQTEINNGIIELFKDDTGIATSYYSENGSFDSVGGYLYTSVAENIDD